MLYSKIGNYALALNPAWAHTLKPGHLLWFTLHVIICCAEFNCAYINFPFERSQQVNLGLSKSTQAGMLTLELSCCVHAYRNIAIIWSGSDGKQEALQHPAASLLMLDKSSWLGSLNFPQSMWPVLFTSFWWPRWIPFLSCPLLHWPAAGCHSEHQSTLTCRWQDQRIWITMSINPTYS